ncbi:MAG: WbqC family protein [Bacteroidales bacterium]|nr:WbqC family protein [Candidatus Scybalousia scybalohippi]
MDLLLTQHAEPTTDNTIARTHLDFFPSIAWMVFAQRMKKISIELYESFPRQTFRNRCLMLSSDGVQMVSVPVVRGKDKKLLTKDVEICWKEDWNVRAWRAVYSNYGKTPFFEYYDLEIKKLLEHKHKFLLDMNYEIFEFLKKAFSLDIELSFTEDFVRDEENNYLNAFQPQKREEDGKLLSPYFQSFSDKFPFQTNLSSLDLLFSMGKEGGNYIKNGKLPLLQD